MSLLVLMGVIAAGAAIGALLARGGDLQARLLYSYGLWRARRVCAAYLREIHHAQPTEGAALSDAGSAR